MMPQEEIPADRIKVIFLGHKVYLQVIRKYVRYLVKTFQAAIVIDHSFRAA
jgi:hypothetical protein